MINEHRQLNETVISFTHKGEQYEWTLSTNLKSFETKYNVSRLIDAYLNVAEQPNEIEFCHTLMAFDSNIFAAPKHVAEIICSLKTT